MATKPLRGALRELLGLLLTLASALLGWAYVAYLRVTPRPPDRARAVPYVWLLGALLALPDLALAVLYALAAAMGD